MLGSQQPFWINANLNPLEDASYVLMGEGKERVIIKIATVRKDGVYNKVKRLKQ